MFVRVDFDLAEKGWMIALIAAVVPLLSGCHAGEAVSATRPILAQPADAKASYIAIPDDAQWQQSLATAVAKSQVLQKLVHATGQMQPDADNVARVNAPMKGKVDCVDVVVGQRVNAHQSLLSLSSNDLTALQSDYLQKEADIDSDLNRDLVDLDCELKQAEAQITLLQKQYDRAKLLFEEKIGSQSQLEATQTELQKQVVTKQALQEKRQRSIKAAALKKELARKSMTEQLQLLGMPSGVVLHVCSAHGLEPTVPIQTPESGVVLERSVNPGEIVDSGKQLFLVDDLDTLWLVADIFEQDVDKVKAGQEVFFTVDSRPHQVYKAKLDFVSGAIDPETRTLAVRATIKNVDHDLKPKMFARMNISVGQEQALAVPKDSVQELGARKVVYIPRDHGQYEERQVQVGEESGDMVEVLSGLQEGDKVVSNGSFMLRAVSLKQSN